MKFFKNVVASLMATVTIIAVMLIISTQVDHLTVNIRLGVYINVNEK